MALYQDSTDSTRFAEPLTKQGKKVICRVYWEVAGKLAYGGKTIIPTALFNEEDSRNSRIGFVRVQD